MRLAVGLDIETTGLKQPEGHRIIELAAVVYDLDTGIKQGAFETRINPERSIDPSAQAVHKISIDDLVSAPVWESVAEKVSRLLSRCEFVVAHNGIGFDLPFIWGEFQRVGVPQPKVKVVDTMLQARWATPDGAVPNLGALCYASDIPYDKDLAHGATYDVSVMMDCFFKYLPKGFFTLPVVEYEFKPMK